MGRQRGKRASRVFLDSNVLQGVVRGQAKARALMRILVERKIRIITSDFGRLEVLPTHTRNNREQARDLEDLFAASDMQLTHPKVVQVALQESTRHGIGPGDSLLLAAASLADAHLFITDEKEDKPIYNATLVTVVSVGRAIQELRR